MLLKITCPGCGRTLMVPEADAGLPAVCNACGRRVDVPAAAPRAITFEEFSRLEAAGSVSPGDAGAGTAEVFQPPLVPALPLGRAVGPQWPIYAAIGGAFLLLMIGLLWAVSAGRGPDTWEPRNRAAIMAMVSAADEHIIAGDSDAALRELQRVEDLVGTRKLQDPVLAALVERAAVQKRRLAMALSARADERAVAVARGPRLRAVDPTTATTADSPVDPEDLDPARITPPASQPAPRPLTYPYAPFASLRVTRQPIQEDAVTDERIGRAIQRGADWLIGRFGDDHLLRTDGTMAGSNNHNAVDALCVYALLQCNQTIRDKRLDPHGQVMPGLLSALGPLRMEDQLQTYGRSLRAGAMGLSDRKLDRQVLTADGQWLLKSHKGGAYTYAESPNLEAWDNSNSQYGLLGVWSAAEAGFEVPPAYWTAVRQHWVDCQAADGSWGYHRESNSLSMTLAGVASLLVCHDYLNPVSDTTPVGRPPYPPELSNGLAWLGREDRWAQFDSNQYAYYILYGFERVGLASGFKSLGKHDWYRDGARRLLEEQQPEGMWGGDEIKTAFALLFLARGRHPILMNKLQFDGAWANRPRDVANLARFAGRELERPLNWQVVSIDRDWTDWAESPILYLASHVAPELTADQIEKIRQFVEAGGLLYTQADAGSAEFDAFARDLAARLFPRYPMVDMPEDGFAYTLQYRVKDGPPLRMVSNGARALMIHSPRDLSIHWHQRDVGAHHAAFAVGMNLFLYAGGKAELRNHAASNLLPDPEPADGGTVRVARLKYAGDWDPEPAAWGRFGRWFTRETNCEITLKTVELSRLRPREARLAHLSGAAPFAAGDADVLALRRYVDAGGTLLIDPLGGSAAFVESAVKLLARAFPDAALKKLSGEELPLAPLLPGMEDLSGPPSLRRFALGKLERDDAAMRGFAHGKGRVLLAPIDLTSGLLGTNTWGILGYAPAYAQSLLKNVLLTAAADLPENLPPAR